MKPLTKKEIQKRVLQNGKPLALNKFKWCEDTKTFSSKKSNLVLDFSGISHCTFDTGADCTFKTGWDCTFKTRAGCTFDTGVSCTFNTGSDCVIVRRDIFDIVTPEAGQKIQLPPYGIKGHLVDGLLNGEPHIIADGILSKVLNQKGNVFKVLNHDEEKPSYLIKDGDTYAHGETLKKAQEDLTFKLMKRDVSQFESMSKKTAKTPEEWALIYRAITGACKSGVSSFLSGKGILKEKYTLAEIIEETQGAYGHSQFVDVTTRSATN